MNTYCSDKQQPGGIVSGAGLVASRDLALLPNLLLTHGHLTAGT